MILGNVVIELVLTRAHIDNKIENISVDERVLQYRQANSLIETSPWLGAGLGNYIPDLIASMPGEAWYFYQPVHNTFMLAWTEIGLFGFMLLLGIIYYLYIHRRKLAYRNSLLVLLLIILMFDHWLWSFHFGILFFWLILGFIWQKQRTTPL